MLYVGVLEPDMGANTFKNYLNAYLKISEYEYVYEYSVNGMDSKTISFEHLLKYSDTFTDSLNTYETI